MAIGVLFEFPGATKAQYEAVEKAMTQGGKLRKLADWPVNKGLIAHMAGPTSTGWRVIDVWESEADFMNLPAKVLASHAVRAFVQGRDEEQRDECGDQSFPMQRGNRVRHQFVPIEPDH